MCGLVGIISPREEAAARFAGALESISHRGPDGAGVFNAEKVMLGHRRLAIIDLSSAGHQPMRDESSGAVIVFNGEIYNYLEIRRNLESDGIEFRSHTDTEVLLKAWLHWGEAAFARLNGMWAFAIWDPSRREVVLSRDRFGVKPLYWALVDDQLMFASEPKALFAMSPALSEPDPSAVWRLFVDSVSHAGDSSFFAGIHALPPAHFARISIDRPTVVPRRYWDYPAPEEPSVNPLSADDEFSALFEDASRLRMRSDVPVGLTLSGGLDSSAILAAVQKTQTTPLHCYTSVYGEQMGNGELPWARIAADGVGAELETVVADRDEWLPTLQKIVWHMDSPGYSPAVFPLWAIMQRARRTGVPVLLEGQGADELVGGYPQYAALAVLHGSPGSSRQEILAALRRSAGDGWTAKWLARQAFSSAANRFGPRSSRARMMVCEDPGGAETTSHPEGFDDPVRRAIHKDHVRDILPALLHYGDAVSMAHGIESRLPFLDYRLVEWFYRRQPPLFADGLSKGPIRAYLRRSGLPAIANRQDKQGYPTPLAKWIGEDARPQFEDWLANGGAAIWAMVDRQAARRLYDDAKRGDYGATVHCYKLLTIGLWLDQAKAQREKGAVARELQAA